MDDNPNLGGDAGGGDEKPKAEDPKVRPLPFRLLVVAVFCLALTITTLNATYVCTWLGEYEYNVQIAKHTVMLFWLFVMAWTFAFPMTFKSHWVFPKDDTGTYFLLGLVCVSTTILFFSNMLLPLLYKGNKGATYTTTLGTRVLPNLDPRMLYNASIWIYSVIGGIGLFFWGISGYKWVSNG
ncbi:hypothetical protein H4R19_005922 [Coemansia spiralis]|nr:hypothetical protein H4R19_005922 [Coemansia spiralis]